MDYTLNYFVCFLFLLCRPEYQSAGHELVDKNITMLDRSDCIVSHYSDFYMDEVSRLTKEGVKAVEIHILLEGNAHDPLDVGNEFAYDLNVWGRANTPQGMPIIELLFHFDLTELTTWSLGIKNVTLRASDNPPNCVSMLSEADKRSKLLELMSPEGSEDYHRLCHKFVEHEDNSTVAIFSTNCCSFYMGLMCEKEPENNWLNLLRGLLTCLRFIAIFLGPLVLSKNLQNEKFYNFDYFIIPKTCKRMLICTKENYQEDDTQHKNKIVIKISSKDNGQNFQSFQKLVTSHGLKQNQTPCLIEVTKYKISVCHKWLVSETAVPVGLWRRFADTLAQRREGTLPKWEAPSKMTLCKKMVGQILLVFAIAIPYYIRVVIYYMVELPKINSRWKVAREHGLGIPYNWDLICYLTPLHTLWIILYANHIFVTVMMVSSPVLCNFRLAIQIRSVAHHSLAGLEHIRRHHGLNTLARFLIWPFKYFGYSAMLLTPLWLLFAFPFLVIVLILYLVPLLFLFMRVIIGKPIWKFENRNGEKVKESKRESVSFKDILLDVFNLFRVIHIPEECSAYFDDQNVPDRQKQNLLDITSNIFAKIMVFCGLLASMLILAECFGFLVDLTVLLLTGIIANAESHFKYVSIVILIVFYSWDVFRDVKKVYRKLNSAMFIQVENQVPELQSVLNLPSNKQENRAFVVDSNAENNQSNFTFEGTNLKINHLVLFVDHYDTPRIPRELFEKMATVKITGTPGSILKNYIRAFIQLAAILLFLLFIFLIILTLGEDYAMSSGTSLFATVIGGLLPMFLRLAFKPIAAEVQLESLSFKGKLNEKISQLQQAWPLVDMEFKISDDQGQIATDQYDVIIIGNESDKFNFKEKC